MTAIATDRLTYEQYMAEEEIRKRYDIIDGVRILTTNPTIAHQKVQGNIYSGLRTWWQARRNGEVIFAPCDVLIHRAPLRTRQPDVCSSAGSGSAAGASTTPHRLRPRLSS